MRNNGKTILCAELAFGKWEIAIPKNRGSGYVKYLAGDHRTKYSDFLSELGFDLFSETHYSGTVDEVIPRDMIEEKLLKPLSEWLGFGFEIVSIHELLNRATKARAE